MADREKVIKGLEKCLNQNLNCYHDDIDCPYEEQCWLSDSLPTRPLKEEALALLKERESLLGIQQTAESITFISAGDAQQGEERGILIGKSAMHEWIKKELIHRGLMTDEIRAVFRDATTI